MELTIIPVWEGENVTLYTLYQQQLTVSQRQYKIIANRSDLTIRPIFSSVKKKHTFFLNLICLVRIVIEFIVNTLQDIYIWKKLGEKTF